MRTSLPFAAFLLVAAPLAAQRTLFDVVGAPADSYGQCCDLIGDQDGDGKAEFLVGAWRNDNGALTDAGSVFVYSGASGTLLSVIRGTGADDHMGYGSSAAGDVNGDGFFDVCAAADEDNVAGVGANAGSATIVSGFDGSVLYTFGGVSASDLFGWSTAAAGDVNGDGRDDVLVGALNAEDVSSPSNAGSLTVFSGADGGVLWRVFGDAVAGQLGSSVGRVGDVNADGRADFAGVQGNTVRVFSGADGSELLRRTASGSALIVAGGLDANADGFDDVLVGSSSASTNTGRVQVVSGRDNTVLWTVLGDVTGDQLGAGVVGCGDLDGDGYGDWAAGLPGFDGPAGANSGAIRAYSGRTGLALATISGAAAGDRIGSSLGGGRDVDGDGVQDVIASSVGAAKAKVVSFVPRGIEAFGTGTAGCDGALDLGASGVPTLGNAAFELHLSHAGASSFLLIGDSEDTLGTLRFGARFHLEPAPPPPAVGVVATVTLPAPDPSGSVTLSLPVPSAPALLGRTFVFQGVSFFAPGSCARRLATSRGLRVTLQ